MNPCNPVSAFSKPSSTRIIHLKTRFIVGGADEDMMLVCNRQAARGFDVTVIVGAEWNDTMRSKLVPEVKFLVLSDLVRAVNPWRDLVALFRLMILFRRLRPDIVHTHTSKSGILGRLAAYLSGVPLRVHSVVIKSWQNASKLKKIMMVASERFVGFLTDAFFYVSEDLKIDYLENKIGQNGSHFVIRSGMRVESFKDSNPVDLQTLLLNKEGSTPPIVFLMVAALEPRKRHEYLLDAFAQTAKKDTRAILIYVGDGPLLPRIEEKIDSLGLQNRVFCVGHQDNVGQWLQASDVCVLSSEREGLPKVIVQYLICGKPVLCTYLDSMDGIVEDGFNGLIVPTNDQEALSRAIERLVKYDPLCGHLTKGAEMFNGAQWSDENMEAEIFKALKSVMHQKHGGHSLLVEDSNSSTVV